MTPQKIIDSHCHIYPDAIATKAVKSIGSFYDIPMGFDGRLETLTRMNEEAGVTQSIIFSVATTAHQVTSINHFIASNVAAGNGRFYGLGTLHTDSENIEADVKQIEELGLKGVKLHPDFQKIAIDDVRWKPAYEACRGKLPILFHTGDFRYHYSNPENLKVVLKAYPDLQVVGAHFGGWSMWERATEELYSFDNLVVDCSSSLLYLEPETAKRLIRKYSASRVLFASDFPMWHPKDNIEYLLRLGLTDAEYDDIFFRNAERVFHLM